MCRRIILCFLCCVLLCCSCLGVAIAADEPDDDGITADDFFRDLGFDPEDEDEVSLFLTWLLPLEPSSEHDMELILSGSEYSELDPAMVYFLWQYLHEAFDADVYDAMLVNGIAYGYIAYDSNSDKFYIVSRLPSNVFDNPPKLATFDFGTFVDQRIAAAGVLTQTSLTTVEDILRDIRSQQLKDTLKLSDFMNLIQGSGLDDGHNVLAYLNNLIQLLKGNAPSVLRAARSWQYDLQANGIGIIAGSGDQYSVADLLDMNFKDLDSLLLANFGIFSTYFGDFSSLLTLIKDATVSTNDLLTQYVPAFADAVYLNAEGNLLSFVHDIRDVSMDYLPFLTAPRTFSYNRNTNTLTSLSNGKFVGITEMVDSNFKDLDSLLLKNFGSAFPFRYFEMHSYSPSTVLSGAGLLEVLSAIGSTVSRVTFGDWISYLGSSGVQDSMPIVTLMDVLSSGFLGLNLNMENALVGGHGGSAQYKQLTFDENLNKSTKTVNYTDLLHAMVGIGSDIQNPLSQLQAVLAGDAALELRGNTQENVDSVTDNFTGSGDGSVSGGNISDASGLTSGIGNAFGGNQVSTGDAFLAATDSGNFDFLSEECAAALDAVAYPAAAVLDAEDDSWLDNYVADEDGFYSVADLSGWSFLDYLGKEG